MSLATRYLRSTPFDMEKIAEEVGFTDVANFRGGIQGVGRVNPR